MIVTHPPAMKYHLHYTNCNENIQTYKLGDVYWESQQPFGIRISYYECSDCASIPKGVISKLIVGMNKPLIPGRTINQTIEHLQSQLRRRIAM